MTLQTPTQSQVLRPRGGGAPAEPAARPTAREPYTADEEAPQPAPPQPAPQPAQARTVYTVHTISPQGFPVDIQLSGIKLEKLDQALDQLLEAGYTAPDARAVPAEAAQPGPPMCPTHKIAMKPMNRPDRQGRTHWCTKQMGDTYCTERA